MTLDLLPPDLTALAFTEKKKNNPRNEEVGSTDVVYLFKRLDDHTVIPGFPQPVRELEWLLGLITLPIQPAYSWGERGGEAGGPCSRRSRESRGPLGWTADVCETETQGLRRSIRGPSRHAVLRSVMNKSQEEEEEEGRKTFISTFCLNLQPTVRPHGKESSSAVTGRRQRKPTGTLEEVGHGDTWRSAPKPTSPSLAEVNKKGLVPLQFVDCEDQVEVQRGAQARLRCSFHSSSLPVACCWIHNRQKEVVDGPQTRICCSQSESTLLIPHTKPDHKGSYTLIVQNRHALEQHTISLKVIDVPLAPPSPPLVSQLSAHAVVLSWVGTNYDGGSATLGYVVEVRAEAPGQAGDWSVVANRCMSTSLQVRSGLEPQGRYRFRVRAYNSSGTSEPSEESDLVKMKTLGQKEEVPTYVTVTVDTMHKVSDHYNVCQKLGVGKFGQVFLLCHKQTGEVHAGKFYRARTSKERAAARREMDIMNYLHHPKLVQFLAAYDTRSEVVMVMEYIAGGELFERIVHESFEHTEPTSACYMRQILDGMQYVHKQGIVHLDLKPENIVCVATTDIQVKIIDFGLASKLEPGKELKVMHGTPEFMAPEVVNYEPVALETDMWSIGVICFILLSGESPFQGDNDAETQALVAAAHYEFDEESFEEISDEAIDFISSLLQKDQRNRLSCDQALAHPWMGQCPPHLHTHPTTITRSLSKLKMKSFLVRRKWKRTAWAVHAINRMVALSNRTDCPLEPSEELGWGGEAEQAIKRLGEQLKKEPHFQRTLRDAVLPEGATAQLTCLVDGYPQPGVEWLLNGQCLVETSRMTAERSGGRCSLVLTGLRLADTGIYTCKATNNYGEALCSAKLRVATQGDF